jgi:dihydropteroate synthase-like protein
LEGRLSQHKQTTGELTSGSKDSNGEILKVLLITGTLAEDIVRRHAQESNVEFDIRVLKIPVAALLTPETIVTELKRAKLRGFDMILVPGLVRGDTSTISKAVGISTFKGSKYAADLPTVLDSIGEVQLSTKTPADDLLREKLRQKAFADLENVEKNKLSLLKNSGNMLIKDLAVGRDFPMRVMAEIVDAPLMSKDEVTRLAKQYAKLGADIVDIGMVAGENRSKDAGDLVRTVKKVVNVPISIDTLNPDEIREAVAAGADLVLSGDAGNLGAIAPSVKEVPIVIIPTNQREGHFPKTVSERVLFLEKLIAKARQLGISKILGDLILEPSNILESLVSFRDFAIRNPGIPLFVGVSNVTELMDADSIGVNALLARISSELRASVLLATEKSDKAKGTVIEEVLASKMMFLAERRGSVPKDIGIDLLVLKDKRNREEPYDKNMEAGGRAVTVTENSGKIDMDPEGMFKIMLDRKQGYIVAIHFAPPGINKPLNVIKGKTAESVYRKVIESGVLKRPDHAAYLGSELSKAEIALKIGKSYVQDDSLFNELM